MDVLIIAPTKAEFEAVVATYDKAWHKENRYHHITKREDMRGSHMPVQIRFVGNWWELPEAPTLEFYAEHITKAPAV